MKILALDQGWRCGFARGMAGETPTSGTFITYDKKTETKDIGLANLGGFVDTIIRRNRPDMVIWEDPMNIVQWRESNKKRKFPTSPESVEEGFRFDGILQFVCGSWEDLRWERVRRQSVLKFFIDNGRPGGREIGKELVIGRCIDLQLVPWNCKDDDRCDAVAMHLYASSYYARKPFEKFTLTG